MAKRTIQEINAGSMADIAFLLLIFFLVTTTMDTDTGLTRKLPPDVGETDPPPVKERNILVVLVNRNNQLLVEGENIPVNKLKERAKEFILNEKNLDNLPALEEKIYDHLGTIKFTTKHVISFRSDRGTSYSTYIAVQNELASAYNELKEEYSRTHLGRSYSDLTDRYKDALDELYKARVSEAEPVDLR